MPKYIDVDPLLTDEMTHTLPVGCGRASGRVVVFVDDIEKAQTADVVPIDDDFCTILICAVRYSIGRQSYMPSLVIDYITPKLHLLNDKCLAVMERDVSEAGYYGHEVIDKPGWMKFLRDVRSERVRRGEQK
jgi:hypothetical protein